MRDFEKLALDGLKNFISGCAIGGSITFFVPHIGADIESLFDEAILEEYTVKH
jgi:hypothetical protein